MRANGRNAAECGRRLPPVADRDAAVRPDPARHHVPDGGHRRADGSHQGNVVRLPGGRDFLPAQWLRGDALEGTRAGLQPDPLSAWPAAPPRLPEQARGYLSRRDIRRSASGFPPVWQVGQYCSAESAKETSRTVSPHTGHGWPARPWTWRPDFFSAFRSPAARPADRAIAVRRQVMIASCNPATSSAARLVASLNGDIFAACSTSS